MRELDRKLEGIAREIFDAMPALAFVVDGGLRIQEYNRAAADAMEQDRSAVLQRRTGNALHCAEGHASPGGCGTGTRCSDCVVRGAVHDALAGQTVEPKQTQLVRLLGGRRMVCDVQVTACSLQLGARSLALLMIDAPRHSTVDTAPASI